MIDVRHIRTMNDEQDDFAVRDIKIALRTCAQSLSPSEHWVAVIPSLVEGESGRGVKKWSLCCVSFLFADLSHYAGSRGGWGKTEGWGATMQTQEPTVYESMKGVIRKEGIHDSPVFSHGMRNH